MASIQSTDPEEDVSWHPSIYYAESTVNCRIQKAWELMLNYQTWNPGFLGATITRVLGEPNSEGEVVQIGLLDPTGRPLPPFYARTMKVEPCRRIAWYCHSKLDDSFRTFLEFGLAALTSGTRFSIQWYSLDRVSNEALEQHRTVTDATVQNLAVAFKSHCRTRAKAERNQPS